MFTPLKALREKSGLSQVEVSKRTGISTTRISLAENNVGSLTRQEEEQVRNAIVQATRERASSVLMEADPRLAVLIQEIERSPSKKKVYESLRAAGSSELEAAIATLGRNCY